MLYPWTAELTTNDDPETRRVLTPVANDVELQDKPERDAPLVYRRTLSSTLTLVGEDFKYLRSVEGAEGCASLQLTLRRGDYVLTGTVQTDELTFEDSRCAVELNFTERKGYDCLLEQQDETVNVLQRADIAKQVVGLTAGSLETVATPEQAEKYIEAGANDIFFNDESTPPAGPGWRVVQVRAIFVGEGPPQRPADGTDPYDVTVTYGRLRIESPEPPGGDWVEIARGVYVAPPYLGAPTLTGDGGVLTVNYLTVEAGAEIDNCLLFNEVIDYFVAECGITGGWRSNFLGKNAAITPDPEVYDPEVYGYAYRHMHHLMVAQKSDVKRADDFQNATRAEISWKEVLELLLFLNLRYTYEEDTGTLIIEHRSHFRRRQEGLSVDLTAEPYASYLAGLEARKGKGEELTDRLTFTWMDKTERIFDGMDLRYDCVSAGEEPGKVTASRFTSNITAMLGDNPSIDDEGFALMAPVRINGSYFLMGTANALEPSTSPLNGALAIPNIQDALWRHEASATTGKMNDRPVTFATVLPRYSYTAAVLMCWEDYVRSAFALDVACVYGNWRVAGAKYSDRDSLLTLDLEG